MPHTIRPAAAAPLIWNRPRLRFIEGAPDGAAAGQQAGEQTNSDENGTGGQAASGVQSEQQNQSQSDHVEGLGDAGKRAIDRMKADMKAAQDEAKQFKDLGLTPDQIKQLIANDSASAQEAALAQERQKVEQETQQRLHAKLRDLSITAQASTLGFHDPADALTQLKREQIDAVDVSATDDVDAAAVKALLEQLAKDKPYLVKQTVSDPTFAGIGWVGSSASQADTAKPGLDRLRAAYAQTTKQ